MTGTSPAHLFDVGVLFLGTTFAALTVWGILDAPGRSQGERLWLRRVLITSGTVVAICLVVAGRGLGAGFLFGDRSVARLGPMAAPLDLARASVDGLFPAALAALAVLCGMLAAWGVRTACRRGRLHAFAGTAALLLGVAAGFILAGGETTMTRGARGGYLPDVCIPAAGEPLLGMATLVLLPIAGVAVIFALGRLFLETAAGAEARSLAQTGALATGTFAAALCFLRLDLILMQNLRHFAIMGPRAPGFRPLVEHAVLGSPVTLAVGSLGLALVALGLPALRSSRTPEERGVDDVEPVAS